MPKVGLTTLGCKVNQYETQRILDSFEQAGYEVVPFNEVADVYVINTCSVTSQAESKSRQTVRRAERQNPNAKVIVTGCAAQMSLNKGERFDGADLLVPNPEKLDTLKKFFQTFPELKSEREGIKKYSRAFSGRTRATLKIQDGCDVYCSYCSIPYTRPEMRSINYKQVIQEAKTFAKRGYKEIVLTGVLIGSYGKETGSGGPNFEDLLELICEQEEITQLRISSIETTQVTDRLIQLMKQSNSKIVSHLHIPLQSGSTKVLRDMNRPYTQKDYLDLCDKLYAEIPDIAISTDIMVGFPTEIDEAFTETVKVCETARYNKAHIFRFSPRYGTPADEFGDKIPDRIKQERSKILKEITDRTRREFIEKQIGKTQVVLVEGRAKPEGLMRGLTRNYIEVEFPGPASLAGCLANVVLTGVNGTEGVGELVSKISDTSRVKMLNVVR